MAYAAPAAHRLAPVLGDRVVQDEPAPAPDLSFLNDGTDQPLPGGLNADPTYLAFLRGMGYDRSQAWATAVQHIAAVKNEYNTAVQRDPALLRNAMRQTDATYSGNGTWFSGGRLADEAQNRVEDEQRLNDLATTRAQALSGVHQDLQGQLSQLARNNADQIAELQGRRDQQVNQDRYINAVGAAEHPATSTSDPLAEYLAAQTAQPKPAQPALSPAQRTALTGRPKPLAPRQPTPKPGSPLVPALSGADPFTTFGG